MTTTGVVGAQWRATVTPWGAVEPWNGSSVVDWFVAADDRWHRPKHEASTRQTVLGGTPVVETRVRIPSGDAVQRVYSVADSGGLTIIEVTNDSTIGGNIQVEQGGSATVLDTEVQGDLEWKEQRGPLTAKGGVQSIMLKATDYSPMK